MKTKLQWTLSVLAIICGLSLAIMSSAQGQITGPGTAGALVGAQGKASGLTSGATAAGPVYFTDGSSSAPGIAFASQTNTGLYQVGNGIAFAVLGSPVGYFHSGIDFETFVPIMTTGTITSSATADLGWTIKTGANTACNTTCTSACVHGWDTSATEVAVSCTDATADKCLCAGSS